MAGCRGCPTGREASRRPTTSARRTSRPSVGARPRGVQLRTRAYENSAGLYTKASGVHTQLHGATHWTKLDRTKMRGASSLELPEHVGDLSDLERAIAASLESYAASAAEANNDDANGDEGGSGAPSVWSIRSASS
eukprot:3738022-Prymnesium_polylepis.1